jgi:hypothetical protein
LIGNRNRFWDFPRVSHRRGGCKCQGTTSSPLPIPLRSPVPILEVHPLVPNSTRPLHLFRSSEVGTVSEAKQAAWYAASRYRGVKANIASEYRAMALAAVKGVYSTGSLAVGILRLFSLDFPSASLCDCVISTVREGCSYSKIVVL